MSEESFNSSSSSAGSTKSGTSKISLNIDDNQKDPNDYFDDGVRKIDFILVWTRSTKYEEAFKEAKKTKIRNEFFHGLEQAGIERESYFDPVEKMNYEKLHASTDFLFEQAARFN